MKCSRCQIIIGPHYTPLCRLVGKNMWTFCGQQCFDDHAAGLPYVPPTKKPNRLVFRLPKPPLDRTCKDCGEAKPPDDFFNRSRRCKSCTLAYNQPDIKALRQREQLLRRYGLTPESEAEILESQGGVCAICKRKRKLCVDHDHGTGKVRGFLCVKCNTGIGMLGDDVVLLETALAYLRATNDQSTPQ